LVAVMGHGVVPSDTRVLTAFDFGATRGDGCFDACRILVTPQGKRVDHFDAHLKRFGESMRGLEFPVNLNAWKTLIIDAVKAWDYPGEAILKMIMTRGPEYGHQQIPTGFVTIVPMPEASFRLRKGVSAITLNRGYLSLGFADSPWLLGGVKTISYAVNMAARREAVRRGADDVVFVSADGCLLEGPTCGLIFAMGDQLWTTPLEDTGILRSITVEAILKEAEAGGVSVSRALFTIDDLPKLEGFWMVSAVRGVLPVLKVNDQPVPHNPELTSKLAVAGGFDPIT
jgi:4-amino-4-deoxychorismate lyase